MVSKYNNCQHCKNWYELRQHHIQDKSINTTIGFCIFQHQLMVYDDRCVKFTKRKTKET